MGFEKLDYKILDEKKMASKSEGFLKEMGRRSKSMAKRFDVKIINQQTISLYGIHV